MSDTIDFGVDYSMVLENLMEEYSKICDTSSVVTYFAPCVTIPTEDLYSNIEFSQLQSKKQECDNIDRIVVTNSPLQLSSISSKNTLEKTTAYNSNPIFPIQYTAKMKKLGLMY
jgi:hypothetical protein